MTPDLEPDTPKPCPFCGKAVMLRGALWPSDGDRDGIIHVEPTDCPLRDFSNDTHDESIVKIWNRRAIPPAAPEPWTREAMQLAIDYLKETKHGSPARSAGHNARLVLEDALAAEPIPREAAEAVEPVAMAYALQVLRIAKAVSENILKHGARQSDENVRQLHQLTSDAITQMENRHE